MKKILLLSLLLLCMGLQVSAQYKLDSNETYAKSFQGKKLPAFSVQEWVTKKPNVKGKYQLIDFGVSLLILARVSLFRNSINWLKRLRKKW